MKNVIRYLKTEYSATRQQQFISILGHLSFLVLGILSLVYYKERMLHFDTANYAFQLIFQEDFYTGHSRYVSYLPQLIPLALVKAGASLQSVLMAYSFSFILLYYLIFLAIVYLFRNPAGGLMLAMALSLTVRFKFYAPVGEVVIGIAFVVLVLGWLTSPIYQQTGNRLWKSLLAIVLSALFLWIHPFPMISLALCWLIWLVYSERWKKAYEYLLPMSWAMIWGLKLLIQGTGTSYENKRLNVLQESWTVISNLPDYFIWDRFLWYLNAHYTLSLILFVGVLISLALKKRWTTLILSLGAWLGIAILVIVLHAYLSAKVYIMVDGYLAHLGLIMSLVFVLILGQRRERWTLLVFLVLLTFSLDRIRGVHRFFADREFLLLNIIDGNSEPEDPKLLAHMDAFDWERLWMPWAISIETLMMSSLNDPEHPQTLYFQDYGQPLDYLLDDQRLFLSLQYEPEMFKSKDLPPQLFLPPGKYKKINLKDRY